MGVVRGYISWMRPLHWIAIFVIATSVFAAAYSHIVSAACYPGEVLNRTCYRGYFSNIEDHGGDSVLPVISNGLAVPDSVNTADELYDLLRDAYASSSNQRQTGAAFIYNTMMGRDAPGTGRTVSNAEWTELYNRLKGLDDAGKIDWVGNVSASVNSFWQGTDEGFSPDTTLDDDAFYDNYKNETGIRIYDYNNNVIYELLRRCANPIGDPQELPEAQEYDLTPHVNSVTPSQVEADGKVSVTSSVDNVGDIPSKTTQWEITQITVEPGQLAPHETQNGTTSATAPCDDGGGAPSGNYFQSAVAECKNVAKGSGSFNLGSPAQNIKPSANNVNVGDFPAGTRICFALSVQPRSNDSTQWAHSKPICTTVGKKPKMQVHGGDIKVHGKTETSTSVKSNKTYGSWVEYGILAVGSNVGLASGSALNDGSTLTAPDWNKLTFANIDQTGADSYGFYTLPAAPALSGQFMNGASAGVPGGNLGNLASGTYKTTNLTITDSTVGQTGNRGKSIIIVATGTVTIDGDITYEGVGGSDTFTSVGQIPQVIIIANRINITGDVGRIDAWLLTTGANGQINTCSDVAVGAALTTKICEKQLTVNGPVQTAHLYLRRTAGSEDGARSDDPAEVFNLRADAYLWGQVSSSEAGKAQTVYINELPPRF